MVIRIVLLRLVMLRLVMFSFEELAYLLILFVHFLCMLSLEFGNLSAEHINLLLFVR